MIATGDHEGGERTILKNWKSLSLTMTMTMAKGMRWVPSHVLTQLSFNCSEHFHGLRYGRDPTAHPFVNRLAWESRILSGIRGGATVYRAKSANLSCLESNPLSYFCVPLDCALLHVGSGITFHEPCLLSPDADRKLVEFAVGSR